MKFEIGKRQPDGSYKTAFFLRRTEEGGINISGLTEQGLTDTERHLLFAHFGSPQTGRSGGRDGNRFYESIDTLQPGTEDHFVRAIYALPVPFKAIGMS